MSSFNIRSLLKFEYFMLLALLGLAFYIAFIPHQNYLYAIHVDEWKHLAYSKAMLQAGDTTFIEPLMGQKTIVLQNNLETGFHLFWGVFQSISGIDWMDIFRFFPSIIFMITVLAVYILAQREGFGWEAAFFTCLIPTTVGILGPGFLVPLTTGLLFTPLYLFLAFNYRTIWSYLILFLFTCFLLATHAPSAFCPIIVLAPYILLNLKGNFKHSLGLAASILLPFLAILPMISSHLATTAESLLTPVTPTEFVQLPRVIKTYGYLPTVSCLLGTLVLVLKGGRKSYGLVLGLLTLLLMLVTFFTFHRGVPIMYERGLMYMMLMLGIVAGAALMGIWNFRLPDRFNEWLKVSLINQHAGKFLCLVLVGITLALVIPGRLDTPYYHMIDNEDYQAFVWIKDNVSADYGKAIVDPWKASAFACITDRKVYTRIHEYPRDTDNQAYAFLRAGSSNTTFLKENEISIVYTRVYEGGQNRNIDYSSNNPDMEEVARNIYLVKRANKAK